MTPNAGTSEVRQVNPQKGALMKSPLLTEAELRVLLREAGLENEPLVEATLSLVKLDRAHGSKFRLGGGDVLEEHIYPVCGLVLQYSQGLPKARLIRRVVAALAHDLDEDTEVKLPEIQTLLGEDPARLSGILSDVGKQAAEYFAGINTDEDAIFIKICDRWNNLGCAHKVPNKDAIRAFHDETIVYVLPLADRVLPQAAEDMRRLLTELFALTSH